VDEPTAARRRLLVGSLVGSRRTWSRNDLVAADGDRRLVVMASISAGIEHFVTADRGGGT
jgi:hypothetical protein